MVLLGPDSLQLPGAAGARAVLKQWLGSLPEQAEQRLSAVITFPRPGYYRVRARAVSEPAEPTGPATRDTVILNASFETLWMVIEEDGGYLTDGFDESVISTPRASHSMPRLARSGRGYSDRSGRAIREMKPKTVVGNGFYLYDLLHLHPYRRGSILESG